MNQINLNDLLKNMYQNMTDNSFIDMKKDNNDVWKYVGEEIGQQYQHATSRHDDITNNNQ